MPERAERAALVDPHAELVDRYVEAAATLGAAPWRSWRSVHLPLLARPLIRKVVAYVDAIGQRDLDLAPFVLRDVSAEVRRAPLIDRGVVSRTTIGVDGDSADVVLFRQDDDLPVALQLRAPRGERRTADQEHHRHQGAPCVHAISPGPCGAPHTTGAAHGG